MHTIESDEAPEPTQAYSSCRVVLAPTRGWDVIIEHDHRIVSITHCTEWHRVERCAMRPSQPARVQCCRRRA